MPVAVTMLVKNPESAEKGVVHYHDIGDYLGRDEKLTIVSRSIKGEPFSWTILVPDKHGDWLEQRGDYWYHFAPLGLNKLKVPKGIFELWSSGLKTERDAWAWNYSPTELGKNIQQTVQFYEQERKRRVAQGDSIPINDFVRYDETSVKWNRGLLNSCNKNKQITYSKTKLVKGLFRPFCKQWLYFSSDLNGMVYQMGKLFPSQGYKNMIIALCGEKGFSALISDSVVDLHCVGDSQCFPLYWYEKPASGGKMIRHDAITDETLNVFRRAYPGGVVGRLMKDGGQEIRKEDIFYYIYGILHAPEYRERFAANLKKELPRIPLAEDFGTFYYVGKALAELHLNYESAEPYPLTVAGDDRNPGPVQKLRWGKTRNPQTGRLETDKSTLIYNSNLTFRGIPDSAHRYVVNGRSPLEWMIDRYQVKKDAASGIVNDPNAYSEDPLYIVNLIRRLVTVSVETMKIVDSLIKINEKDCYADFPEAWKTPDAEG